MGPIVLALALIRELTGESYGLTLQELAGRLRRPASTLQRVLRVLEDQQLVVRSARVIGGPLVYVPGPILSEPLHRAGAVASAPTRTAFGSVPK